MTPSASGPYQIICPQAQRVQLPRWAREAAARGELDPFLAALQTVNDRLTRDPEAWGDPQYRLPYSGMVMCHRLLIPLSVWYAVDPGKRLVFIKAFARYPSPGAGP